LEGQGSEYHYISNKVVNIFSLFIIHKIVLFKGSTVPAVQRMSLNKSITNIQLPCSHVQFNFPFDKSLTLGFATSVFIRPWISASQCFNIILYKVP